MLAVLLSSPLSVAADQLLGKQTYRILNVKDSVSLFDPESTGYYRHNGVERSHFRLPATHRPYSLKLQGDSEHIRLKALDAVFKTLSTTPQIKQSTESNPALTVPEQAVYLIVSRPVSAATKQRSAIDVRLHLSPIETYVRVNPIQGIYGSFGSTFGNDSVADNPDGDDYGSGSGARISAGFSFKLRHSDNPLIFRSALGFRFQGGEGNSHGIISEATLLKRSGLWGFGLGVVADSGGRVKDINGLTTDFEPVVVPKLVVEYPVSRTVNIGFSMLPDHEFVDKSTHTKYKGPNYGVYLLLGARR